MTDDKGLEILRKFYIQKLKEAPEFPASMLVRMQRATDVANLQLVYDEFVGWLVSEGYTVGDSEEE